LGFIRPYLRGKKPIGFKEREGFPFGRGLVEKGPFGWENLLREGLIFFTGRGKKRNWGKNPPRKVGGKIWEGFFKH